MRTHLEISWSSFRTGVLKNPLVRFRVLDASLAGLDSGELITIQSLADLADWERFEATRKVLGPSLTHRHSAARYGIEA